MYMFQMSKHILIFKKYICLSMFYFILKEQIYQKPTWPPWEEVITP